MRFKGDIKIVGFLVLIGRFENFGVEVFCKGLEELCFGWVRESDDLF